MGRRAGVVAAAYKPGRCVHGDACQDNALCCDVWFMYEDVVSVSFYGCHTVCRSCLVMAVWHIL